MDLARPRGEVAVVGWAVMKESAVEELWVSRFAGIGRIEEAPESSIFLTYGLSGASWCTDRAGYVHDGCR